MKITFMQVRIVQAFGVAAIQKFYLFFFSRNFSHTINISGIVLFTRYDFTLYHEIDTANFRHWWFGDSVGLSFYLIRFTISSNNF